MQETFKDIFALFEYLRSQGYPGLVHTAPRFIYMEMNTRPDANGMLRVPDGGPVEICAVPMPTHPLYRGQNTYYPVCKPALYRSNWSQEALFERELQMADFKFILNEHPEIKDRIKGNVTINYEGLAQHYGIPTDILDFTNSPLVAAFFATTTYDAITDRYAPVLHAVSQGVIYFSMLGSLYESMIPGASCTMPIGMDALHRPGEQRAYGRKMKQNEDLNTTASCQKFFFWHAPEASLKIWQMCNGSLGLFPYDPMADKVRNMRKYRVYSEAALQETYSHMPNYAVNVDDARNKMIANGCKFVNYVPFAYTQEELDFVLKELHQMYPNSY